jgi:hypothetical protein
LVAGEIEAGSRVELEAETETDAETEGAAIERLLNGS